MSKFSLKKVEEAASGVYDYESAFEAITQDHQHIERVLVERAQGMKINKDHVSVGNMSFEVESLYADGHDEAIDDFITLVKEVLQGK